MNRWATMTMSLVAGAFGGALCVWGLSTFLPPPPPPPEIIIVDTAQELLLLEQEFRGEDAPALIGRLNGRLQALGAKGYIVLDQAAVLAAPPRLSLR